MSGQSWLERIGRANSEASLVEIRNEARQLGRWTPELHDACLDRLHALKPLWKRFGIAAEAEAQIRADERLKVLREVRKGARRVDIQELRKGDGWNHSSGEQIIGYLTRLLAEQRERTGDQARVEAERAAARERKRAAAEAELARERGRQRVRLTAARLEADRERAQGDRELRELLARYPHLANPLGTWTAHPG